MTTTDDARIADAERRAKVEEQPEFCSICGDWNWDYDDETGEKAFGICRRQAAQLAALATQEDEA